MAYKAPQDLATAYLCTSILTTLSAHSSDTGILSLLKHASLPAFCSHFPLSGGLFPQVVLTIMSLLKSHLYNKTFPDHLAKVASQSSSLIIHLNHLTYVFYMCELCFPPLMVSSYDGMDQALSLEPRKWPASADILHKCDEWMKCLWLVDQMCPFKSHQWVPASETKSQSLPKFAIPVYTQMATS